MVLVDTTVWVDFLANRPTSEVAMLERLIHDAVDICTCGIVLAEVLQGIRSDRDYRRTELRFRDFSFLEMNRETFLRAASLYRSLRHRGITIRKPVDCMIAAVALDHDVPLLHNDRDFDPLAEHCGLKTLRAGGEGVKE